MAGITRVVEGETPNAMFLVLNESGVPVTGLGDVEVKLHLIPDDKWWDGAAWVTLDPGWLIMTEEGEGQYRYELPDSTGMDGKEIVAKYRNTVNGAYGGELFLIYLTGAGATPAQVADAVWDEILSGHVVTGSAGVELAKVSDVKAKTDNLPADPTSQTVVDAAITNDGNATRSQVASEHGTTRALIVSSHGVTDGLITTVDGAVTDISGRLPLTLIGGRMRSHIEASDDIDFTVTQLASLAAVEAAIIVEIDANEVKIDALDVLINTLIGIPVYGSVSDDIAFNLAKIEATLDAVLQIQNNVGFTSTILERYQIPSSPQSIDVFVNIFDGTGTPVNVDVNLTIELTSSDPTHDFGPTNMSNIGLGRYKHTFTIQDTWDPATWRFEFDYALATVAQVRDRLSELSEEQSDLDEIQLNVQQIHTKVKATDLIEDIPDQIDRINGEIQIHTTGLHGVTDGLVNSRHDITDEKVDDFQEDFDGFQAGLDVHLKHQDKMHIPFVSSILTDDFDIGDTGMTIETPDLFRQQGFLMLESEKMFYGKKGATGFTIPFTRGAFGTIEVDHLTGVIVRQMYVYEIKVAVFNKDGDPVVPGTVSIKIQQEGATGSYVSMDAGDEPHLFKYYIFTTNLTIPLQYEVFVKVAKDAEEVILNSTYETSLEPATFEEQIRAGGELGDYTCDERGWFDAEGVLHEWPIEMRGAILDNLGSPEDDVSIVAYLRDELTGEVNKGDPRPPMKATSQEDGTWDGKIGEGTFTFYFYKDGREAKGPVDAEVNP